MNNLLSIVLLMFASCIFFFIHLRSEFLMFAYLIVYTGAIMVMFLFVVMTIDVKSENMKTTFSSDLGLSFVLTNVLTSILYYSFLYGGGTILSNLQDQEKDLRILKGKLEGTNSEKAFPTCFPILLLKKREKDLSFLTILVFSVNTCFISIILFLYFQLFFFYLLWLWV